MECIVNRTDFKILVKFRDTTQTVINPLDFEWDIYHYTTKYVTFKSSHKFGTDHPDQHILSPNVVILDDFTIEIRVDNFDFTRTGILKTKSVFYFKNDDFVDGIQTLSTPETQLNVTII